MILKRLTKSAKEHIRYNKEMKEITAKWRTPQIETLKKILK